MKKILVFVFIVLLLGGAYYYFSSNNKEVINQEESELSELIETFDKYAITTKETSLYEKKSDEFNKVGTINEGIEIKLGKVDKNYFFIEGLDYYVDINDLESLDSIKEISARYKDYIVFNENIKTKDTTSFYDQDNKLVYTINDSFDLPIIIKEKETYGVEFNDRLLFINKSDVKESYEKENTKEETRTNIRTFTYHTVYDPATQKCTSIEICHPITQFEEQMKYLHENDFMTLTMEELEMFLDKKIRVPKKTVVLSLDDGIFLENSIPLVEKYEVYATFFIITSKTDVSKYFDSKYARFESHTDDLHNNYKCPLNTSYSQGGQMLCEKHEKIVADLKLSQEKLKGSYYFAYPFFDYNTGAINALKEAGFKMAFIGQFNTNGYSDSSTDRYLLRRKTIFGNLKLDGFIEYIS